MFIKETLQYAREFSRLTGRRFLILLGIILVEGVLEGVGLFLFFPLFNLSSNSASNSKSQIVCANIFSWLGLPFNTVTILTMILCVFLVKFLLIVVQGYVRTKIVVDIKKELRFRLIEEYSVMKYSFFTQKNPGYFNNLITTEVDTAVASFTHYCTVLVSLGYIGVCLTGAAFFDWRLTLGVLVAALVMFRIFRGLNSKIKHRSQELSVNNASIQKMLIQYLHNFKYLKATHSFKPLHSQLENNFSKSADLDFKMKFLNAFSTALFEPICIVAILGIIFFEVVIHGKSMTAILFLLVFLFNSFQRIIAFQNAWQKFLSCYGGLHTLQDVRAGLSHNREQNSGEEIIGFSKNIILDHVEFAYSNKPVLLGIKIEIKKNTTVALVGPSGSGKTTIVDLIAGLYAPSKGHVLLDGKDIQNIRLDILRSMIGYVTQEPVIFNDTVSNNISFWSHGAKDQERIKEAAILANCAEFIEGLDQGYETLMGDKGVRLSGGQRQRLAIARELYAGRQIIIFDEATSALDSQSEKEIHESLINLKGKLTVIIIAHRLSTIRHADYIYVMDQGHVVEDGSWDSLALGQGTFTYMLQMQGMMKTV